MFTYSSSCTREKQIQDKKIELYYIYICIRNLVITLNVHITDFTYLYQAPIHKFR